MGDSTERRRTARLSWLSVGSLVQGCDRLQHERSLGSFAEVTLDEVDQEVRELFSQVRVPQRHAQVSRDVLCFASAHHSEVVCYLTLREGSSCPICQMVAGRHYV